MILDNLDEICKIKDKFSKTLPCLQGIRKLEEGKLRATIINCTTLPSS